MSTVNVEERFLSKVDRSGTCWEWQAAKRRDGYGVFWSAGALVAAHRHSYETFVGSIPDGLVVRHRCDNRGCVRPTHLEVGSKKENSGDMVARGPSTAGTAAHNAKLNEASVAEIRRLMDGGTSQRAIAELFGISHSHAWRIGSGRRWKHVK